jgi:HPt (histidine-containing phosphotransfer) domain-containing protein
LADEQNELKEPKEQKSEVEKEKAAELVEQATKDLRDKVTSLEAEVAAKTQELDELKKINELNELNFEGARAAYAYAVEDYKKLAAVSNPLIPAEAISGTTIEEVRDSLERASRLVAGVQEALTKQAQASSVPAGAPVRAGLDTSAMSTKEKINYGLEQARKRKE